MYRFRVTISVSVCESFCGNGFRDKGVPLVTTISDIARTAGVSKTTVSRVLNGNLSQVSPETRERVQAVIDRLGYTPNALAKGLKSSRTGVIGIVLSDLQNPFWTAVLDGIERACRSFGFSIMICNACKDPQLEEEHIRGLRDRRVDGIIINPTARNSAQMKALVKAGFPVVALNRKMPDLAVETVSVDNVRGAYLATEHLIRLGRRRIALVIYTPDGISTRLERMEGYLMALNRCGLEVDDSLIHIVEDRKDVARALVKRILQDARSRPDAIFSTNNLMSLEILEAIRESNVQVPRQLSLVGYDETAWSALIDPPMTVVKQPAYEMGEQAAAHLIRQIRSGKPPAEVQTHYLEPVLIVRGSCGAGPAARTG